jgi:hypothetical protein
MQSARACGSITSTPTIPTNGCRFKLVERERGGFDNFLDKVIHMMFMWRTKMVLVIVRTVRRLVLAILRPGDCCPIVKVIA